MGRGEGGVRWFPPLCETPAAYLHTNWRDCYSRNWGYCQHCKTIPTGGGGGGGGGGGAALVKCKFNKIGAGQFHSVVGAVCLSGLSWSSLP